jgi:hypothetical protein
MNNLTEKQFEQLKDCLSMLSYSLRKDAKSITKDNVIEELKFNIASTMESFWNLVDENKELKEKLNDSLYY